MAHLIVYCAAHDFLRRKVFARHKFVKEEHSSFHGFVPKGKGQFLVAPPSLLSLPFSLLPWPSLNVQSPFPSAFLSQLLGENSKKKVGLFEVTSCRQIPCCLQQGATVYHHEFILYYVFFSTFSSISCFGKK